jgi:hypothetical protein
MQAFLPQIPKDEVFGVGVIDGHLQLMMLHSGLGTWDRFLLYLFVNPIKKLFAAGCPTVVLCFDSYDTVPIYKSMTQQKRASKTFSCDFVAGDDLPTSIPQNDTMSYMMNRHFKLKVFHSSRCTKSKLVHQDAPDASRCTKSKLIRFTRSSTWRARSYQAWSCSARFVLFFNVKNGADACYAGTEADSGLQARRRV